MRAAQRFMGALELTALRLLAPRWFRREPLDVLLSRQRRGPRAAGATDLSSLERDVLRVEAALARAPFISQSCLYCAIARYALLRRRGHAASFVLGIDGRGLEAPGHAWVEVGARPFAEDDDVSCYLVTYRYPLEQNGGSLGS